MVILRIAVIFITYFLHYTWQDTVPIPVSIDVATCSGHGTEFETPAKNADRALEASKAQGWKRATVSPPE